MTQPAKQRSIPSRMHDRVEPLLEYFVQTTAQEDRSRFRSYVAHGFHATSLLVRFRLWYLPPRSIFWNVGRTPRSPNE